MTTRVLAVVLSAFSLVVNAQEVDTRPTLPESISLHAPAPFNRQRQRELLPPTLAEMTAEADLIIQGSATPGRPYLSADQRDLYTDYLVVPSRVIFQRNVATTQISGVAPSIILKRWGGRTVINKVEVILEDVDLREFTAGDELVLFLVFDPADKKYQLAGEISGAFAVKRGKIEALVQHSRHLQFNGMTPLQFESEVRRLRP
jgi:hypothetical protein